LKEISKISNNIGGLVRLRNWPDSSRHVLEATLHHLL